MEKNAITLNGKLYRIENGKLFDVAFGHHEVDPETYVLLNRGGGNYILIFQNRAFHYDFQFSEIATELITENPKMKYFRTCCANPLNNLVFYQIPSTGKNGLMGYGFEEIIEDEVFKIGKKAYQLYNHDLVYLCQYNCHEMWKDRLEIHTGEKDYSEMFAYEKRCGKWELVHHYRPVVFQAV